MWFSTALTFFLFFQSQTIIVKLTIAGSFFASFSYLYVIWVVRIVTAVFAPMPCVALLFSTVDCHNLTPLIVGVVRLRSQKKSIMNSEYACILLRARRGMLPLNSFFLLGRCT